MASSIYYSERPEQARVFHIYDDKQSLCGRWRACWRSTLLPMVPRVPHITECKQCTRVFNYILESQCKLI